ncbi:MAG: type II secretion system GspH family protein [Blastocatellia bacterium]|nr:type II secretion system GspH family protein [Blastocatellia bacterium]
MKLYNLSISKKSRPLAHSGTGPARGFTLFELVMVMTIIVILAAVGVASYQQIQLKARETLLKQNLKELRKLLDQYTADKEALPQSLEDLVTAGYIREVPIDPITGEADWTLEFEEDDVSIEGGQGVGDIRSNAPGQGSDGIPYREY